MTKLRKWRYFPVMGSSTCSRLLQPIGDYPVFFLFATLLPIFPDLIYSVSREMTFIDWRTLILTTLLSFFRAYVLTLPLCLRARREEDEKMSAVRRVFQSIYRNIVLLVLGSVSFAENFLQLRFGTLCTPSIIQVLWETDKQESTEFLKTYCSTSSFIALALFFAFLIVGYTILRRRTYRFEFHKPWVRNTLTILLLTGFIVSITRINVFCELALRNDTPTISAPSTPISTFERIHTALAGNNFSPEKADKLLRILESAQVESCSQRSSCIVLIIGESFNKYHSSLYGYSQSTNPRLAIRQQRGELFVFDDVVAPANLTTSVLNQIFSPSSINAAESWDKAPLFPALFKKAGYATYHIDNQTAGAVNNFHDLGLKNLFNTRSNPLLFTANNQQRHPFDMALIDDYRQINPRTDAAELTIFHLMGQHVLYKSRFPADQAVLTPDHYNRPDLTPRQTQILADYDNATLYNDLVVDSIIELFAERDAIVIYLSDHSEEVFDYRSSFGRTYTALNPDVCRYQFDIPLLIWMSDIYRHNHPEVVDQVGHSVDRPFTSDDLPHLLMDLAGIECRWFDPTRSLVNDHFDASRPRLLLRGYELAGDYDEIMHEKGDE